MSQDTPTLMREVVCLREDLARARCRPWNTLKEFLLFKALTLLSRASPPLPGKVTRRLARSAAKRDPNRSIRATDTKAGTVGNGPDELTGVVTRYGGRVAKDPAKRDILIVSHDASRTGAPILTLNLVQALSQRYNVTTLCLRGGSLISAFRDHSVSVMVAEKAKGTSGFYGSVLREARGKQKFAFAVVNSIEARHMLPPLRKGGVPSVTLLHEFASYTPSKTAFRDAITWADHTVFSTRLTLENALEAAQLAQAPGIHVLPQGKCVVPTDWRRNAPGADEIERLTQILRPNTGSSRRFVVVGAGYVQIRKGVDLFLAVAMRVLAQPEGRDAVFVWIGGGYAPETDFAYSVYLQDQLQRAGLTERVMFLPETSEIETVYRLADALAITSRLDPLPNVAIDAMCAGLPVLCFEKTTGIAETLASAGLAEACVAGYLDTCGMADKLLRLASDAGHLAVVKDKTRTYAARAFDFDAYARAIENLALQGTG